MPVIATNLAANSAVSYLNINSAAESQQLGQLSSGSRIVNASDDAAGLAIATTLSSNVTMLQQAATNASQATSILQVADGGASNISDILARMESLASEASSGTTVSSSLTYVQAEFTQLQQQIDAISTATQYSGQSLLNGSSNFSSGVAVVVGANPSNTINISLSTLSTSAIGASGISVTTAAAAATALTSLAAAIGSVSSARANIGAQESRFNFASSSISTQTQNLTAATSAIKDVDVASAQASLASDEVKTQAAVSAEIAANQIPQ